MVVAIVPAQNVHPLSIDSIPASHPVVPRIPPNSRGVQLKVSCGVPERHALLVNNIRSCEVVNHTVRIADAQMPDERNEQSDQRQRCPHEAVRKAVCSRVGSGQQGVAVFALQFLRVRGGECVWNPWALGWFVKHLSAVPVVPAVPVFAVGPVVPFVPAAAVVVVVVVVVAVFVNFFF